MIRKQFTCNMKCDIEALKSTNTKIFTPPQRSLFKLGHVFCRYCQSVAESWWATIRISGGWNICQTGFIFVSDNSTWNIVSIKSYSTDCFARWYKHFTGPREGFAQRGIFRGPRQVVLVVWFIILFLNIFYAAYCCHLNMIYYSLHPF